MPLLDNTSPLSVTPDSEQSEPGFSYTGRDGAETKLSSSDHDQLVAKIVGQFQRYDTAKSTVRARWKKTEQAVRGAISQIESQRFNALVPYGKQTHQTLISHFWGRSLQTDDILFSCYGKDDESKLTAAIMKQHLLELLKADGFQQKLDDGVDDALLKGVIIGHVGYVEEKQTVQVLSGYKGTEAQFDPETNQQQFTSTDQIVQDGPSLTIVDPENFVFDTSNHLNWNACFKAYRSFKVYEDIEANPDFSNFEGLDELNTDKTGSYDKYFPTSNQKKSNKKDKQANNDDGFDEQGRINLIEFHGDIRLPDKTYLRNYTIVIAARRRIIQFEPNRFKINPFVKWEYERTADGWGLAAIDHIVGLINAASTLMNTSVEAAKISINPPMLAPKGMLPQKKLYLMEGRVIEYEISSTHPNIMPQPIPLQPQVTFPFMQLFETMAESTTGATRQLSGNVTSNDNVQTATEFQGLQVVGNLILDRLVDRFNLYFKIPIIQKVALIASMFNPQPSDEQGNPKQVEVRNETGIKEHKPVTPDVIYGNYHYLIEDNKSEIERKQNVQQKIQMFTEMLADPELNQRAKKVEIASTFLRDMGYQDAASWFMNDAEMVQKQLRNEAMTEQVQLMVGQMQQQARAKVLMEHGVNPNDAAQLQATAQAYGQQAGGNTASPPDAGNTGMGAVPGNGPPVPGQPA